MFEITIINEINGKAFLPLLCNDAKGEFEYQYLSPGADEIEKDVFAIGIAEDNQVVGAISFEYTDDNYARITSLFVREEYRRRGCATELVISAADFCQMNEMCTRLDIMAPTFSSFENSLDKFFNYLEFEKEDVSSVGCFEIRLEEILKIAVLSREKTSATFIKDTNRAQKNSLDLLNCFGLTEAVLNNEIDGDISTCLCDDNIITDCVLIKNQDENLVLAWAEISPKHPVVLVDLLAAASKEIAKKYPKDQTILIPYINDHSMALIKKFLGSQARNRESYTHYWIDLDAPYYDEAEAV